MADQTTIEEQAEQIENKVELEEPLEASPEEAEEVPLQKVVVQMYSSETFVQNCYML